MPQIPNWTAIVDSQTPSWIVVDSQTPSWTTITDTQTPNWVEIT